MSWESTIPYYRLINEAVKARLGGLHSAKAILYSVDFHEVEQLQHAGDWEAAGTLLMEAARALESAGADFLVLCTNTMHKVAPSIESAVSIPLLHIADATGEKIKAAGITTVGLLGTRFTMEQDFYRERLHKHYNLNVLIPGQADRNLIHKVIYEELCLGRIVQSSRDEYRRIMADLVERGAQAVILGCTEISLLVSQKESDMPLYDTTGIHAQKAVEWALTD